MHVLMTLTPFRLRVIRSAANMTQQQLADLISVNRSTITKYEIGARGLSPEIEKRLTLALSWDDPRLQDVLAHVEAWRERAND